jgi:translocation and assembly module TamA
MQRLLLSFLISFYTITSFAQININVEINGVSADLVNNIRLYLSIEQQKGHALLSEARLRRLHKKAPQEIANALQPFGYYRPAVKTELTQVSATQWKVVYTIDPGPPLPVGQFNFTIGEAMRNDPAFKTLIDNPPLHTGGVFNHLVYEDFKSNLAKLAAERGYFSARFSEHRVEVDLEAYEARVYLNYEGVPRYRFGDVSLRQDVLNPELLRRYIPFEKGSPYTLYELIDLQQALNDTDYFRTVEVSPAQPQPDSAEIPVSVMLTPRKRHHYSIGLGYGTNTGIRTKFGWDISPLNKRGHRLNTEAKVSEIGYSLGTQYRVPVLNPRTDQIIYSTGIVNEKTDTSESTALTIGASLNRNRGSWRETLSLNYQQEKYAIADDRGVSNLLIPGANWRRTWGRNFIYTVDGLRFDIGLRGASKALISDTDFFQIQGGIKAINSLGQRNRIITSGNVGATWTQEFNQLPSSVRFFTGGAQSVRGYAYQSLGPVDANGKVIGGQYLVVGSIEFEHSLNDKWGVALFYDIGNALDNINDALERGAGFGVRWKSPVGTVRIDLANAISRDGRPWRIHFNIGPDL